MELSQELEILVNENVKVYLVTESRDGKVVSISDSEIKINLGTKKEPMYVKLTPNEYRKRLNDDTIVHNKRVIYSDRGNFTGVRPREGEITEPIPKVTLAPKVTKKAVSDLLRGYINKTSGKFSESKKRGYTEIEYRPVKTMVTIELTTEQIEKLKELGVEL